MGKQKIKIDFGYFWSSFKKEKNFILSSLSENFDVEISDNPDYYFFTYDYLGTREYLKYKCHRIYLGWENCRADWNICDYAVDSDFIPNNPNHKRFPLWAPYNSNLFTKPKREIDFLNKSKFCCMVVSNAKAKERIEFFSKLSKYKKIDSGGRYMNNIGGPVVDKLDFIKDYKFVISFENSASPGYTTEKLIEPMLVNSIPVYWGNEKVNVDFNTKSFINVERTDLFDEAIERIIELDKNEEKYLTMAAEPWFINNEPPLEFSKESLAEFFKFIIEDSKSKTPVAQSGFKRMSHEIEHFKKRVYSKLKRIIS